MKTKLVLKTYGLLLSFLSLLNIILFIIFYVIAAKHYPGGSWLEPDINGFSFWHNYLCDLLDINAINGKQNEARLYAIVALCFLCTGILFIWSLLPKLFTTNNNIQKLMGGSGYLSLFSILFLVLGYHDIVVRIAGIFGLVAFVTCCIELYRTSYVKLFLLGVVCIIIFLCNYYIYETGITIHILPFVQKITFILFIVWFIALDLTLYQKIRHPDDTQNKKY
ncbi:hypothetical protein Q2T41_14835 [Maribacter confluentis]|uniref:DUF998 domain-containing protein n=1 Tax=Maribacter confluentis TaxID=1656093 RepID=A0ABT8RSM6_9FLAO|nr:hypothetical protein [Maribacter confluentis]MDO1513934.1 hypothetical protein [Maribacter confluentis]